MRTIRRYAYNYESLNTEKSKYSWRNNLNLHTFPMSVMVLEIYVSVTGWWWDDFFRMPAVLLRCKVVWPFSFERRYRKIINLILKLFLFFSLSCALMFFRLQSPRVIIIIALLVKHLQWIKTKNVSGQATFENRQNALSTKMLLGKFFLT